MQQAHHVLDPNRPFIADNLCALAVMTKAPRAGQVKTRLVPPLTAEQAAQLNICFLRDTARAITEACGANARGIGVYTPAGSESAYLDILPPNFELLPQRGDGFGERLTFAAADLFQCGFASVCLIDSDSPTVSAEAYRQAVELLSQPKDCVVLGPSDDGGYYLIGIKRKHPELFERIDWSTERVCDQTKQRAQELGLEVNLLPAGYDVDDGASLQRLRDELLSSKSPSEVAPHTRKFLAQLAE
ncbi:MAG TPA: TIGR04282 family arsenosugar biosynthesis glycosyltransferase [Chthoniobacterales bacterium]